MDDHLRRLLNELHETIQRSQADGTIDAEERQELRDLIGSVEQALAAPEEDHDNVMDDLEAAAVRFEGRHPTVAAVIRSAVDTLTGYGI